MPDPQPGVDLHTRIANALLRLGDASAANPAQAAHSIRMAIQTIEAARDGMLERERELEALTDPGLVAAKEVVALRRKLEQKEARLLELELQLFDAKTELEVQEAMAVEDDRERKTLERRVKDFDKKLMTDDEAFSRYMDSALDEMGPGIDERAR